MACFATEALTSRHEKPFTIDHLLFTTFYACLIQRITSGIEAFLPYISMPVR
jgi:hypothetical protein